MILQTIKRFRLVVLTLSLLAPGLLFFALPGLVLADSGKTKVLYHVDGKDPEVAKYAMALIDKHIEAEGGPDKIDVVLVVHGPALKLFEKETVDPGLRDKLKCQVSMKLFGTPLEKLVAGFKPTAHPVAVKRIADLQKEGYLYIKP
jgi:intracellular sulfur oxidation DsrE/DsrF family protein